MQCQRITPCADHRKYPVECPDVPTDVRAAAGRYLLVSVAKRLYPLGARLPGMEQRRLHAPKECNWPWADWRTPTHPARCSRWASIT